jgi:hypothetical protein
VLLAPQRLGLERIQLVTAVALNSCNPRVKCVAKRRPLALQQYVRKKREKAVMARR